MKRIQSIRKQTDNRFLNLYELEVIQRDGHTAPYYVASRAKSVETLKISTKNDHPDGVLIYGVYGEKKDAIVLVRQFRYPIDGYIYEFPAGLVESGETIHEAAIREMYEETGLTFTPVETAPAYSKAFYTTIGMTDECCGTLYGYCSGIPNSRHQEAAEDIEVVLADRDECKRILKEENVSIMTAYMLMHFIHDTAEDPLAFLHELE
jgi:ADP-ribose pyrophosphatase